MRNVSETCQRAAPLLVGAALAVACVPGAEVRPSQAQAKSGPPARDSRPSAGALLLAGSSGSTASVPSAGAGLSPPPGQRWVRGYWHWNGVRHVYVPARLERMPARSTR
ncbi:MAG TPA: hypothetical protein VI072_27340 [Polyangiaceae bacterium]